MKTSCNVPGCPDHTARAKGPCPMHASRARKGRKSAGYAGALRDGSRTTTLIIHCAPGLRRQVQAIAAKYGISLGRAGEDLIVKGLKR